MAKILKLVDYSKPGWHYGDHVKILNNQGRKDKFTGSGGTVIAAEGEYLRIKLDEPINIKGVGMVTNDLWMPYLLRKTKSRNPGEVWHKERAEELEKDARNSYGRRRHDFHVKAVENRYAEVESKEEAREIIKRLTGKVPKENPISKKVSWLPIIIVAGLGYLWWKNRTQL